MVDPRLVIAVSHQDDLNEVTWECGHGGRAESWSPRHCPAWTTQGSPLALACRESLSTSPMTSARPGSALAADRPTLLDVRCDPNVPPIPPHATLDQMKDAGRAILKGDQDRWGVVKEGVLTKVQELLPHKDG